MKFQSFFIFCFVLVPFVVSAGKLKKDSVLVKKLNANNSKQVNKRGIGHFGAGFQIAPYAAGFGFRVPYAAAPAAVLPSPQILKIPQGFAPQIPYTLRHGGAIVQSHSATYPQFPYIQREFAAVRPVIGFPSQSAVSYPIPATNPAYFPSGTFAFPVTGGSAPAPPIPAQYPAFIPAPIPAPIPALPPTFAIFAKPFQFPGPVLTGGIPQHLVPTNGNNPTVATLSPGGVFASQQPWRPISVSPSSTAGPTIVQAPPISLLPPFRPKGTQNVFFLPSSSPAGGHSQAGQQFLHEFTANQGQHEIEHHQGHHQQQVDQQFLNGGGGVNPFISSSNFDANKGYQYR